jgi:hypothetical protein
LPPAAARHSVYALVNANHKYRPSIDCTLILSPDPLGAALVAAAVDVAGVRPVFAQPDEPPKSALRRLRPACVLIAADDPCLRDDAFLGPAKMTGARLLVFGHERDVSATAEIVSRYALETLVLPRDAADIGARVTGASESNRRPQGSTAP